MEDGGLWIGGFFTAPSTEVIGFTTNAIKSYAGRISTLREGGKTDVEDAEERS